MTFRRFPKLDFDLLRKVDVVIFDEEGSSLIQEDLQSLGISYEIIDVRGARIRIWPLMLALLGLPRSKEALSRRYFEAHVHFARPAVLVSIIDNDWRFWRLGAKFKSVRTIAIQNGWRSEAFDVFEKAHDPQDGYISDLFCFNQAVGALFRNHVSVGRIQSSGSYRSNRTPRSPNRSEPNALWISQFSPSIPATGRLLTPESFMEAEAEAVTIFFEWAQTRSIPICVLGRHLGESARSEQAWFENLAGDATFEFLPKSKNTDHAYWAVDQSSIIGTCDSTLGYEALAREKSTFFFSIRPAHTGLADWRFGWPDSWALDGPFWTSGESKSKIFLKLDKLHLPGVGPRIQGETLDTERLMSRDQGNQRLLSVIARAVRHEE